MRGITTQASAASSRRIRWFRATPRAGWTGIAVKPLTVGFHETQFLTKLNGENQLDFWFQLSGEEQQQVGSPWGPVNPQALNRTVMFSIIRSDTLTRTDMLLVETVKQVVKLYALMQRVI
jgi:hypothetical protein